MLFSSPPPDEKKSNPTHDLHAAISNGDLAATIEALNAGADVNGLSSNTVLITGSKTPLGLACFEQQIEIAELLIMRSASLEQKDQTESTPLHYAQDDKCAELLLRQKATIDATDIDGDTPLMRAVYFAQPDTVSLLLAHKADPTLRNKDHDSVLDMAITSKRFYPKLSTQCFNLIKSAVDEYNQTPRPGK